MRFRLFHEFDSVEPTTRQPAAADLYRVLSQFREAVQSGSYVWSGYPTAREYAAVCFWAIRKMEYSFAAEAVASLEANAAGPLRVLDVGCGVVPLCNWMSHRGHDVSAIDPIQADIDFLNHNNLNEFYQSRVRYGVGRAERLRFPANSFDVVTCISVLEHMPPGNDRLALFEMARVLKPGGHLIITFDVAPTARSELDLPDVVDEFREYAQPFSKHSAARLLRYLRASYENVDDVLPAELEHLSWMDVHAFWRTAQAHDGRSEPEREYLAMGGVLTRGSQVSQPSEDEIAEAYFEGQRALEERVHFFQEHAKERLTLIDRLNSEGQVLQAQLEQKEQLIQTLDSEARERLEVVEQLHEKYALTTDVDRTQTRLETVENLLIEQADLLKELSARVEGLHLTLQRQTDLLRGALSTSDEPDARGSAILAAILSWRQDIDRILVTQGQKLGQAARDHAEAAVAAELRALRREKEAAEAAADARLAVIEEQKRALSRTNRWRFATRVRQLLEPRIGVLYHYEPRPLVIPNWYTRPKILASTPEISIVTPTRNQGPFLERTLRSVLDQDYVRLQYIVQDGASSDETLGVLDKYSGSLARVVSEPDSGFACAINRGFRAATGEILAYLNSDDLLLPGTLNYVASYFERRPDVDVVYGHRVLIDEYDQEIGRWVLPPHDDEILSWADYVPQETLFWRRRIWERIGGAVDESFKFAVDWDLLLRFRDAGAKIHRVPRFLAAFRVHPHQKTSTEMRDNGRAEMERLRERALGRKVTTAEIGRALSPYLRRHFIYHKLYRLGLLRY